MMKVVVAKSAGFCRGVRRAVDKARLLAVTSGRTVFTDGLLIHNAQMMDDLRRDGVVQVDTPEQASGTILLKAHGVSPARRKHLEQMGLELVDCTCPDVAKIQGTIRKYSYKGYYIVIFGDPGHAEVMGLLGYCDNGGAVVRSVEDVRNLPDVPLVCLVSQTTQFPASFVEIGVAVQKRFHEAVVIDTICRSTKRRQEELTNMACNVDAIVVVGGLESANTRRLFELASEMKPSFLVQTADQLVPDEFKGFKAVGLTAGASTPDFVIQAVRERLEKMKFTA